MTRGQSTGRIAARVFRPATAMLVLGLAIGMAGCGGDGSGGDAAPPEFTVVAAGDIAQCGAAPAAQSGAAKTAALVAPRDELVLTLGDNAYQNGTAAEFADCFHPTWGALRDKIRPVPGNHDYGTAGAAAYFDYFSDRAGPMRRGYYSFDHGGWHFIALNSHVDFSPESEQFRWLEADLAASAGRACAIAYVHMPAFGSGANYGGVLEMRAIFGALQSAGVEIVLSGHEHVYERFAPQRADGTPDAARGLRQFVVGTGGAQLGAFGAPAANSEFREAGHWGVLRLTLGDGKYAWQFLPAGGGVALDSGTGTCHR